MGNNWIQLPSDQNPENNGHPPARNLSQYGQWQLSGRYPPPSTSSLQNNGFYQQAPQQISPCFTEPLQDGYPYRQAPSPPFSPHTQLPFRNGPGQQDQEMRANPVRSTQDLSNKALVRYGRQNGSVLYRHPSGALVPLIEAKRWKRSRTLRLTMQRRHRRDRHPKAARVGKDVLMGLILFVAIIVSSGSAYAYSYYQSQFPRLQGLANQQIPQTTHIYDRNGTLLYDSYDQGPGGGRRTPITYDDVPQVMKDAMIAAEDHTFWTNAGIDLQGVLRAATNYAQTDSVQGGGSTITQQLIKNLTGDNAVTLGRKLPEATLAVGLTSQYPKSKILEMYFNVAPFGAQDLGVESAVEEYFKLERTCDASFHCSSGIRRLDYGGPQDEHDPILALARASLLAGMPQNPVNYDPTFKENLPRALSRQDYVLHQMFGLGMEMSHAVPITPQIIQKVETLTAKMTFTYYIHAKRAPHFVEWVIKQLTDQLGVHTFVTGGFNIRTTVDANLEDYVERAVRRHLTEPEYQPFLGDYGPLNTVHNVNDSAVVVMNAKTGEILAMDGSTDFASTDPQVNGQFNAAISPRQPGSAFKPIVYASAFEMGWYPGIVLPDVKTYFPNGGGPDAQKNYSPTDYGGGYSGGATTIRSATANSRNIPAIKALMFAGINNVADMARRMGITAIDQEVYDYNKRYGAHDTVAQRFGPSLALGTVDIPLLQMVGAYQVFADQGQRILPQGVLDIWDSFGRHLYHYDAAHPRAIQVITPQIAYMMTSVLADEPARALEFGSDHVLSFSDWDPTYQVHQVAAKTGTTDGFKDNWAIGYTPDVVVGVWSGNADNSDMIHTIGLTGAAPIWHSVIERASGRCNYDQMMSDGPDGIPCGNFDLHFTQTRFVQPDGLLQQAVSSADGLQGSGSLDWMLDGEQPLQAGINDGIERGGKSKSK
ncbi:MAG: transglycosylase domain-containing protein [Ktedonobacteraceae bacterium]|nr:transglycosylase domain-containing protein [Ktedonobacteraceae bacterium]